MSADDDDLLAAELALGLLDAGERREAEARLVRDPAFAAAHRRWLDVAERLLDAPEVTPPSSAWARISAALAANDDRVSRGWRATALVAGAAALALGVIAVERRPVPPLLPATRPARPLLALLSGTASAGAVAISIDRANGRLMTAAGVLDLRGRSAELWVIPDGGKPRSLGLIADQSTAVPPPAAAVALLRPGATLAVSLEPRGGSPTGQPTGPVVLTGKLTEG